MAEGMLNNRNTSQYNAVHFSSTTNCSLLKEKELARVRRLFVEKSSKELISQLLDDILEDGVVNAGEKDSILEENKSTADKARCLIDTVINHSVSRGADLLIPTPSC